MVGQWAGKGMGGCYNKGKKRNSRVVSDTEIQIALLQLQT